MDVHKMCIYIPLNFQNQIQKTHGEKKRKIAMWIVCLCVLSFCDTIHIRFVFYVSNLVLKISRMVNTSCERLQILFEFFKNLQIRILKSGIIVSHKIWYH
jgi:hypothetical protein